MGQFNVGFQQVVSNTTYYHEWFHQPLLLFPPEPQMILDGYNNNHDSNSSSVHTTNTLLDNLSIWFAVPKSKISHQKKRMKTTLRCRIPRKQNIITDPRTGELTLRHHLPWNWKNYLPNAIGMKSSTKNTPTDVTTNY
jgi:ribosomal protein L32